MAKKEYVVGSANVFADLAHHRPAEALAKAELARKIGALIAKRGLTQAAAADVLEVDQPKVSALTRTLDEFAEVNQVGPCDDVEGLRTNPSCQVLLCVSQPE